MTHKIAADRALALRAAVDFIPGRFGRYGVRAGSVNWAGYPLPVAIVRDLSPIHARQGRIPYLVLGPNYAQSVGAAGVLLRDFARLYGTEHSARGWGQWPHDRGFLRTRDSQVTGDGVAALDLIPNGSRLYAESSLTGNRYRARNYYLNAAGGLLLDRSGPNDGSEPAPAGDLLAGDGIGDETGPADADEERTGRWRECVNCGYEYDHDAEDSCPDCGYER